MGNRGFLVLSGLTFALVLGSVMSHPFSKQSTMDKSLRPQRPKLPNSPIYFIQTFTAKPAYVKSAEYPQGAASETYMFPPLVKLPLRFMSNARPVDIIRKIASATTTTTVVTKPPPKKSNFSKIYYLPLKFVSNAKPFTVLIKKPPFYFR